MGRNVKYLLHGLIWSVAINIGLVTSLVCLSLRAPSSVGDRLCVKTADKPVLLHSSNLPILQRYFSYSFQDLVLQLSNSTLVRDGYKMRDLALSCLVAFHHFPVQRALGGFALSQREMTFVHVDGGECISIPLFPGLCDDHFQALVRFANAEKWPLTAEGLFYELKRQGVSAPASLQLAWTQTKEFSLVLRAFERVMEGVSSDLLYHMILEGDFDSFQSFLQKITWDASSLTKAEVLRDYLNKGCVLAANLLVDLETEFALHDLSDEELVRLIALIQETKRADAFLKNTLQSMRSDRVHKKAAQKLYFFAKASCPTPYDHAIALQRFVPGYKKVDTVEPMPKKPPSSLYVVQYGDSLWKIAKKYRTTVAKLKKRNNIKHEYLIQAGDELVVD